MKTHPNQLQQIKLLLGQKCSSEYCSKIYEKHLLPVQYL